MTHLSIFLENDNLVQVDCLSDVSTTPPALVTSAHVQVTFQDTTGTDITSFTWPLSLTNVAPGRYQATVPTSPNFVDGPTGVATAKIEVNTPFIATWHAPVAVTKRSL